MKKLWMMCGLLLCLLQPLAAQEKIVEKSQPRQPKWLGISMADYIITSATNAELEAAKGECLSNIRQTILNSVSVNISSEEQLQNRQHISQGKERLSSDYLSEVKTIAAKMPYITNISLSDAEVYWVKRYHKKKKTYRYEVHVKYSFPEFRRKALVVQFLKQDRLQYEKYLELKEHLTKVESLEEIQRCITDLTALKNYFVDSRRRDEVEALQKNYRQLYDAVSIVPYESELGRHVFCFMLEGRKVRVAHKPVVKAEFATNIEVKPLENGMYELTYCYDQCWDDDLNVITLIYRVGGHVFRHEVPFDVREGKTEVIPFGRIEFYRSSDEKEMAAEEQRLKLEREEEQFLQEEKAKEVKIPESALSKKSESEDSQTVEQETSNEEESLTKNPSQENVALAEKEQAEKERDFTIRARMFLRSKYVEPFQVVWISLSGSHLDKEIECEPKQTFQGKGTFLLKFETKLDSRLLQGTQKSGIAEGSMKIKNLKSQKIHEQKIILPYVIK